MLAKEIFESAKPLHEAKVKKNTDILYSRVLKKINKAKKKGEYNTVICVDWIFWIGNPTHEEINIVINRLISQGFSCKFHEGWGVGDYGEIIIRWYFSPEGEKLC